ncbi:Uncharacterised protein [BD1-7 clade bacterium]|uniref:DUF748 domain-containing protein n=1 Tax=BD1-7 clade bacterium TaxID=2029982 RepID=A0A5S9Q8Y8_9GAMM|nr:Uncharacterised protein [BD1-7 clade bacterium]CAA0114492.1 Uncharacterised protein [BD1-7 clade bacterium]
MQTMQYMPAKLQKFLIYTLGFVAIWSLLGFLVLPWVARDQGVKQLSQMLGRDVRIDKVAFNPWTLELWIDGFAIGSEKGSPVVGDGGKSKDAILAFDAFYTNLQVRSIWRGALSLELIRLDKPAVHISLLKPGVFNFTDILASLSEDSTNEEASKSDDAEGDNALFPVQVADIDINEAEFVYLDQVRANHPSIILAPISFKLEGFTTLTNQTGNDFQLRVTGERGGIVETQGDFTFNPLGVKGHLDISNIALQPFFAFVNDQVDFHLASGRFGLASDFRVVSGEKTLLKLADGSVRLTDLELLDGKATSKAAGKDQDALIFLKLLSITGIELDSEKHAVAVKKALISELNVDTIIEPDGSINLVNTLVRTEADAIAANTDAADANSCVDIDAGNATSESKAEATKGTVSESTEETEKAPAEQCNSSASAVATASTTPQIAPEWTWNLSVAQIEKTTIHVTDKSLDEPARMAIDDLAIKLEDIRHTLTNSMPVSVQAQINQQGKLDISGQATAHPVTAALKLVADDIHMGVMNPYVKKLTRSQLKRANIDANLGIDFALDARSKPSKLELTGDFSISDLELATLTPDAPLVQFESMAVQVEKLSVFKNEYHIKQALLVNPIVYFELLEDGSTNVAEMTQQSKKLEKPIKEGLDELEITAEKFEGKPLRLLIDTIQINDGDLSFTDNTVKPVFSLHVKPMDLVVENLTSEDENAKLTLQSRMNDSATLSARGVMNVMQAQPSMDVVVKERGLAMKLLSPYSATYVNYPIDSGIMSFDLNYKLKNDYLDGQNNFRMADLKMGDKLNNPDALDLPIPLALTFMRNNRGVVDLDMDVTGRLDDPSFDVGDVITDVFTNIIFKAISSPFTLLGALASGDKQYKNVLFAQGSAELDSVSEAQLSALADSMRQNANLVTEMTGTVDYEADEEALSISGNQSKIALQALADKRGQVAFDYVTQKLGIAPARVSLKAESISSSDRDASVRLLIETQ